MGLIPRLPLALYHLDLREEIEGCIRYEDGELRIQVRAETKTKVLTPHVRRIMISFSEIPEHIVRLLHSANERKECFPKPVQNIEVVVQRGVQRANEDQERFPRRTPSWTSPLKSRLADEGDVHLRRKNGVPGGLGNEEVLHKYILILERMWD